MNFIEAVQSLKNGLCESITRESWSGTLLSLSGSYLLQSNGNDSENIKTYANILADDWELVNPKPQTETVEVKKWAVLNSEDGSISSTWDSKPEGYASPTFSVVELSGTYEKPVKPKVKRREEIIVKCGDYQDKISREYRSFTGLEKIYREWEE